MAEEKKPLWGKKGKYKPESVGASGRPFFKGRADDLISGIKSERRGFDIEINLTKRQAKKYSDLVSRAQAEGVVVNAMGKKKYRQSGFSYKSTGVTNVPGGFAMNERGQAAQAKFESLGGKVLSPRGKKMGNIVAPPSSTRVAGDRSTFARYYGVYAGPKKSANRGKRFRRGNG